MNDSGIQSSLQQMSPQRPIQKADWSGWANQIKKGDAQIKIMSSCSNAGSPWLLWMCSLSHCRPLGCLPWRSECEGQYVLLFCRFIQTCPTFTLRQGQSHVSLTAWMFGLIRATMVTVMNAVVLLSPWSMSRVTQRHDLQSWGSTAVIDWRSRDHVTEP